MAIIVKSARGYAGGDNWIKTTAIKDGIFDGCIDFSEVATAPGSAPSALRAAYTRDHLHLNPAGYHALADGIDLNLFVSP